MLQIERNFQSLSEWATYAQTDLPTDDEPRNRSSCNFRFDFTGVQSKEEAFRLLREGYPAGRALMESVLEKLLSNVSLVTLQEEFTTSVEGCAPNVEAYIQGQPEDMFSFSSVELDAPPSILTVQFEMLFAARISAATMSLAGAIVFAAIQALRAQGCAVSPLLAFTGSAQGHQPRPPHFQYTLLLPSILDIDTFAFMFTHPAVLRVITFSVMEHEPEHIRNHFHFYDGGGYSYPAHLQKKETDVYLSISKLCQILDQYNSAEQLTHARQILQTLVDSKFTKLQ